MNIQSSTNPLNEDFWVDAEYNGPHIQSKAALALTAAYGALGVGHLIERCISEMNHAAQSEHEYAGLKPVLLENILCAQHVLLTVITRNLEQICEDHKESK